MKVLHYLFVIGCIFLFMLSLTLLSGCGSSKTDGIVTPGSTSTASRFTNPNGYITAEINGKLLEIGLSTMDDVSSFSASGGYGYNIAGTKDGLDSLKSIYVAFGVNSSTINVNALKGAYNSGTNYNGVSVGYTLGTYNNLAYPNQKAYSEYWSTKNSCTVEITSVLAPWIEGTFTVDGTLPYTSSSGLTPKGPITIKKGTFKIRYK